MSSNNNTHKTHSMTLLNKSSLGAWDFPEPRTLTIKGSDNQECFVPGKGKKELVGMLYFVETDKFLVVNATKRRAIESLYGPWLQDWYGKKITLYAGETRLGREMVPCIYVMDAAQIRNELKKQPSTGSEKLSVGEVIVRLDKASQAGAGAFREAWKTCTAGLSAEEKQQLDEHTERWKATSEKVDETKKGRLI